MDDRPKQPDLGDKPSPKGRKRGYGRPWVKGQSGNPLGAKVGRKHRVTGTVTTIVVNETEKIVGGIIDRAKAGDPASNALFLRYLRPQTRYVSDPFPLPSADSAHAANDQIALLVSRLAGGMIDIPSAMALIQGLQAYIAGYRETELEDRLIDVTYGGPLPAEDHVDVDRS
jgi:hypothetical protein